VNYRVFDHAAQPDPLVGSELNGTGCLAGQRASEVCWTSFAEEGEQYDSWAVAFQQNGVWMIAEGLLALSEILLPVVSTWKTIRQSPSDRCTPTMGVPFSILLDDKVESTKVGIAGAGNEGEGPG